MECRGLSRKWELMWNMSSVDLPDGFSQRPSPLGKVIGESLMARANRSFTDELVIEERMTRDQSDEEEEGEISEDEKTGSFSLNINSPIKERRFDTTLEFTSAGSKGEGEFKLEVKFNSTGSLSQDETTRESELALALRARISMWKRSGGYIT